MITEIIHANGGRTSVHGDGTKTKHSEYYLKSTDPKPIEGVENADVLYEMDTHDVYLFDADTKTWLLQ